MRVQKRRVQAVSALFLSTLTHSPANGAHAHDSDAENPMGVAGRLVTLQERELTYHDSRVSVERAGQPRSREALAKRRDTMLRL